ncbi:hypothetical protein H6G81_16930 [Scytonema hofmannii FACHB-248]|uniref:Uncharacterized protein n=1 Tax=Scytonema hofmannii FACHB-248 TaxID=1842502 RepID=A0ABR8GRT5_9CYAN|nr:MULTISPECIES: hypothetical protein [Nostocales]MBD2606165.1 hypothetical protein [Scytonema hofmannii FACHB-248]
MNTNQDDTMLSRHWRLPKPDLDNITVLAHNLPNKPILPWNNFDSPWLDTEAQELKLLLRVALRNYELAWYIIIPLLILSSATQSNHKTKVENSQINQPT